MAVGIVAMITMLLSVIATGLQWYTKQAPERDEAQHDDNIQQFRENLQTDAPGALDAALAEQHDRVLQALGGSAGRPDGNGQQTGT